MPEHRIVRTTMPHRGLQTDAFKTPEGWAIVAVNWFEETVGVTWLVPAVNDGCSTPESEGGLADA